MITQFFRECFWYGMIMAVVYLFFWMPFAFSHIKWKALLFLGIFLIMGSIANGFWSLFIWNHFYYSTDYVIDFTPFWPITQNALDAQFGGQQGYLKGVSLAQLNLIWIAFSITVWGSSIWGYRIINSKFWAPTKVNLQNA